MKKFTFAAVAMATLFCGFRGAESQACDRTIYNQGHRVVYSSPAVNTPAPRPEAAAAVTSSVIRTSTVVQQPVTVTTVESRETVTILPKVPEIPQGSVITARVRFAGAETGEVLLVSNGLEIECKVLEWSAREVVFRMPDIEVVRDAHVTIKIMTASGDTIRSTAALLVPPPDFKVDAPATSLALSDEDSAR